MRPVGRNDTPQASQPPSPLRPPTRPPPAAPANPDIGPTAQPPATPHPATTDHVRLARKPQTANTNASKRATHHPLAAENAASLHPGMGVLVQIRDIREHVYRRLKARAASSGVSLSEYLRVL